MARQQRCRLGLTRRQMDIKTARADLKKRQEKVVEGINQNATQQQQLAAQMRELLKEVDVLNGETRMLERLSKDSDKTKKS